MSEHHLDIVRQVLDRQVVDANHVYCGKVDNIVIDLDGKPKITGILIGNGPASDRLPEFARWLSRKLFGQRQTKIPWEEVLVIKDVVKLASDAKTYGIDERTGWAYDIVSKFPGAWKK
jgi:sporulation protein YlmC with PRC-barrel domain